MAGSLPSVPGFFVGTGYEKEFTGGFARRYDDGTLRAYIPYPSAPPRRIWKFVYTDISKDQFAALEAFWEAHANAAPQSAAEFTFTDPLTGATRTAVFVTEGRKINPQISDSCRVSVTFIAEEVD